MTDHAARTVKAGEAFVTTISYALSYSYTSDGVAHEGRQDGKTLTGALATAKALAAEHGARVVVQARIDHGVGAPVDRQWYRFATVTRDGVLPAVGLDEVAAYVRQRAEKLLALADDLDAHYVLVHLDRTKEAS